MSEELPEKPQENSELPEMSIPKELKKIIDELPADKREAFKSILAVSIRKASFKSPIPPPEFLQGYNEIIPNGAERILKMAENQAEHRIYMERTVISREQNQSGRGQNYGLIVALSFLLVSGILIYTGHDVAGGVMGSIDLVGLVAIFITGKHYQARDKSSKKAGITTDDV